MRRFLAFVGMLMAVGSSPAVATTDFAVLAYHEIVDDAGALTYDAITTRNLAMQFDWLRANGYQAIGVDDILAAQRGERPLPPRAVLLTFDDGYRSFYTRAFPLLRAYGYRAVLSVVGSFLEVPPGAPVRYGTDLVAREDFVSWAELRELQGSGLVEIGSHTYALHTTAFANPAGGELPAAVGRTFIRRTPREPIAGKYQLRLGPPRFGDVQWLLRLPFAPLVDLSVHLAQAAVEYAYDPALGRYETDAEFKRRIRADLERNSALLAFHLGKRPRVITWPYGRWTEETVEAAREVGMPVSLTLDPERADAREPGRIGRFYATANPDLGFLVQSLKLPPDPPVLRGLCVNLDEIHAATEEGREERLGRVLDAVVAFQPNVVLLATASTEAPDGALYFPAERRPVRSDVFNRAAWQMRSRAGVDVYAWLPIEQAGPDPETQLSVYGALAKAVPFAGLGIGPRFLAGDLTPVPPEAGVARWDPRVPRRVRAAQEPAGLPERARQTLRAIQVVARFQPAVSVLDVVELDRLRPPAEVVANGVDYLAVRWDGRPEAAVRTLRRLGWLDSEQRGRLVPMSARGRPADWRVLQGAGLVSAIYCPDRLLDQPGLGALSEVLGGSLNPFRR
jgi:peptidoglycan/xylan/chitin deacetylase (PgdA/CDA1 family)